MIYNCSWEDEQSQGGWCVIPTESIRVAAGVEGDGKGVASSLPQEVERLLRSMCTTNSSQPGTVAVVHKRVGYLPPPTPPTPGHPLLKGGYTGHEKTYSGDIDISPGLAETKRNQQILEKSDLPIFLGSSRFFLN